MPFVGYHLLILIISHGGLFRPHFEYGDHAYYVTQEWRARLLMEQSSAIKSPSISYHLVGTKKIQQELAKPAVLER